MIDLPQSGLDPAAFARLERTLSREQLHALLRRVLEKAPLSVGSASIAYAGREMYALAEAAKALEAIAEEVCALRLTDMCRRLYGAAIGGDKAGCTQLVTALDGEWDAVKAAIEVRLRRG